MIFLLYNIKNLLNQLKISNKEKEDLIDELKTEFPNDEMLFELHLYRAIQYLKKRETS